MDLPNRRAFWLDRIIYDMRAYTLTDDWAHSHLTKPQRLAQILEAINHYLNPPTPRPHSLADFITGGFAAARPNHDA